MHKLWRLWRLIWNREIILYIIAGVLTTLVNLAVFTGLSAIFGYDRWWLSNFPAIVMAIVFAFVTNKLVVFRSRGPFWQELVKFFASRIVVSLVFEYGAMFLLYNLIGLKAVWPFFGWSLSVSKLLTQVLVMAGNYVLSKWFIFTGGQDQESRP